MDLLWPDLLRLLGLIPLVIAVYIWGSRRQHFAVRYSRLGLIREAIPRHSWLRKHLPFILFVTALFGLVIALARPILPVNALAGRTTIILALDISRSMCM